MELEGHGQTGTGKRTWEKGCCRGIPTTTTRIGPGIIGLLYTTSLSLSLSLWMGRDPQSEEEDSLPSRTGIPLRSQALTIKWGSLVEPHLRQLTIRVFTSPGTLGPTSNHSGTGCTTPMSWRCTTAQGRVVASHPRTRRGGKGAGPCASTRETT